MRKVLMFLFAMVLIVGGGSKANALSFFSTSEFEGTSEFMGVTPFDPELGTLEEVNVSISGTLYVSLLCEPVLLYIILEGLIPPSPMWVLILPLPSHIISALTKGPILLDLLFHYLQAQILLQQI